MKISRLLCALAVPVFTIPALADDWPQWMGPRRDDVWRETGIVQKFAANGPPVLWRVPIDGGYSGPAVAGGKLFVMDRPKAAKADGEQATEKQGQNQERVRCLDAKTGATVWEHAYACAYNIGYPGGPRTTPVVADGRVYTLG